jgi:glutamate-1-semialdehyde 2,1-aminomutase
MELGGINTADERVFLLSTTHGAEMCGLGAFVETVKVYQELDVIGAIWQSGTALMEGMNGIAHELGIADHFSFVGVPCSPNFLTRDGKGEMSLAFRTLFVQEMVKNSVLMPWVALSYSHGETEIYFALEAARKSLTIYRQALADGVDCYLEGRAIKPVFRKFN